METQEVLVRQREDERLCLVRMLLAMGARQRAFAPAGRFIIREEALGWQVVPALLDYRLMPQRPVSAAVLC